MDGQVVVTGLGAVTPVGNDRESTWQALVKGVSGVDTITAFDPSGLPTQIAGEVKGFDPAALLDDQAAAPVRPVHPVRRRRRAGRRSPTPAWCSTDDADRTGVVGQRGRGRGVGDASRRDTVHDRGAADAGPSLSPLLRAVFAHRTCPPARSPSTSACTARSPRARWPARAASTRCSKRARLILSGEADVVVCGGTDAGITPVMFAGLSAMGALSKRNDDPAPGQPPVRRRPGRVRLRRGRGAARTGVGRARRRPAARRIYADAWPAAR